MLDLPVDVYGQMQLINLEQLQLRTKNNHFRSDLNNVMLIDSAIKNPIS